VCPDSLSIIPSAKEAETKRPWETLKPPMAFRFNSNTYGSAGQTSPSFFTQHHQFILFNKIIFSPLSEELRITVFINK
jgi:hypothetical protein